MSIRTEIYNKVLALIDNFTEDGVEVSIEDNIDVEKKCIEFVDMAQKEMWKNNKATKPIEIVNKPPINRLESNEPFELKDFEGETQYFPDENGIDHVQGYSIQVDGTCILTYEENVSGTWTQLVQLTPTGLTEMTEYKGVLNVTSVNNKVRLKIEGTTHFLHQNRALWKFLYEPSKVPSFEYWVKYDLPNDFNAVDAVVIEDGYGSYEQLPNYKIENFRDLYISFFFKGTLRITYKPIPTTVTSLDEDLQIDVIYAQSIVYDICAKLGFYENPDLVNWSEGRRIEMKQDSMGDEAPSAEVITDYYGGSNYGTSEF